MSDNNGDSQIFVDNILKRKIIEEYLDDIEFTDDEEVKRIVRRSRQNPVDLWNSGWGLMLRNPENELENSFQGKLYK